MLIRDAKDSDIRSIAEVHVASSRETYGDLCDANFTVEAREVAWREWMPTANTSTLVAETDTGVVGFANFGPTRDADQDSSRIGELYSVYVHPDNIGEGIGFQLTADSLQQMRSEGYEAVTLWALDTNERAIEFYERAGFISDGASKTSEKDGRELVEMRYCKKFD